MAFPPPTLATNRTNATPSTNTHPGDHNAVNAAVNDINGRVQAHDAGTVKVGFSMLTDKVRSVDTPNDIELHWDAPSLYFRIDGGEWNKITSVPI